MNKPTLAAAALLLVAFSLPAPVESSADYCYYPFSPSAPAVATPVSVLGPWPNGFAPGACPTGTSFVSTAASCPPLPFVGPIGGQYCGPLVPAGLIVHCSGIGASGAHLKTLVAGYDVNLDGDIDSGDGYGATPGLATDSVPDALGRLTVAPYPHPTPTGARLIVYPVADSPSPNGIVSVGCSVPLPVPLPLP